MSTPLNLAEQLLLLALDEKGADRASWGTGVETGLAGALLLEPAAAGCLAEEGGRLVPAGCDLPGDPLLRDALDVVCESGRPRRAASWIRRLPRELRPLRQRAAERLVARGVLAEERRRLLGVLPRTRFPEVDRGPEAALRERLREVLTGGAEPAPREAMLIALMEPYDLVGKVVGRGERRDAQRRAKEMRRRIGVASAVGEAVRSARASAIAAVVAASSAAATSGGGDGGGGGG